MFANYWHLCCRENSALKKERAVSLLESNQVALRMCPVSQEQTAIRARVGEDRL
jgi:hypothetical protein